MNFKSIKSEGRVKIAVKTWMFKKRSKPSDTESARDLNSSVSRVGSARNGLDRFRGQAYTTAINFQIPFEIEFVRRHANNSLRRIHVERMNQHFYLYFGITVIEADIMNVNPANTDSPRT